MRTRTRKVTYRYCDFCNKRMVRLDAMKHHEDRCTLNPERNCGLCKVDRNFYVLVREFEEHTTGMVKAEALRWLDRAVKCPACMLTVLRLSKRANEFRDLFCFADRMAEFNERRIQEETSGLFV